MRQNVITESPKEIIWKESAKYFQWKGNRAFCKKWNMVDCLYLRTIEEGLNAGRGTDGHAHNILRSLILWKIRENILNSTKSL